MVLRISRQNIKMNLVKNKINNLYLMEDSWLQKGDVVRNIRTKNIHTTTWRHDHIVSFSNDIDIQIGDKLYIR